MLCELLLWMVGPLPWFQTFIIVFFTLQAIQQVFRYNTGKVHGVPKSLFDQLLDF